MDDDIKAEEKVNVEEEEKEEKEKTIQIPIKDSTRKRLREHGKMGDTYDSLIQKILQYIEDNGVNI